MRCAFGAAAAAAAPCPPPLAASSGPSGAGPAPSGHRDPWRERPGRAGLHPFVYQPGITRVGSRRLLRHRQGGQTEPVPGAAVPEAPALGAGLQHRSPPPSRSLLPPLLPLPRWESVGGFGNEPHQDSPNGDFVPSRSLFASKNLIICIQSAAMPGRSRLSGSALEEILLWFLVWLPLHANPGVSRGRFGLKSLQPCSRPCCRCAVGPRARRCRAAATHQLRERN